MKRDGNNPTLLYAYGGYGIRCRRIRIYARLWFDRGGVYVVANIRGGGSSAKNGIKAGNSRKSKTCS